MAGIARGHGTVKQSVTNLKASLYVEAGGPRPGRALAATAVPVHGYKPEYPPGDCLPHPMATHQNQSHQTQSQADPQHTHVSGRMILRLE